MAASNIDNSDTLAYAVNHIFLPPQLPHEDDFKPKEETEIVRLVHRSLEKFRDHVPVSRRSLLETVMSIIGTIPLVHEASNDVLSISEDSLRRALVGLSAQGGSIPLYVRAQNAGIIMSMMPEYIQIEAFEVSALNQAVVSTKGRLRRSFPGTAVAVSKSTFRDENFQAALSSALARMSHQQAIGTRPKVKKAKQMHEETRDTNHPKMITELLASFLMALGGPADVSTISKNTRDEVFWRSSPLPWRRSPMWLLIRVVLQLTFTRLTAGSGLSGDLYKEFMVFLMADILHMCHRLADFGSDLLSAMNSKVARRLHKLDSAVCTPALDFIHTVMLDTNAVLRQRWEDIMVHEYPPLSLSGLAKLDFKQDALMGLVQLDQHIYWLTSRTSSKEAIDVEPGPALPKFNPDMLPSAASLGTGNVTVNLAAFETWVRTYLPSWADRHTSEAGICGQLAELIKDYHTIAASHYHRNPEGLSILILTILELWKACDIFAVQACRLLQDYDHGIPVGLLESLVLPSRVQMTQLLDIEEYLIQRSRRSKYGVRGILQDFGSKLSFSVRYFNQSLAHQNLLITIEAAAASKKEQKIAELRCKQAQYASLVNKASGIQCERTYNFVGGIYKWECVPWCQRCRCIREADNINIEVHEWPLPEQRRQAQSVAFELQVPECFREWRDVTVFLHLNVLGSEYASHCVPRCHYQLQYYSGLSSFASSSSQQRIILLSENKPHVRTHRRGKDIATATVDSVCVNNGLNYHYYDTAKGCFVDKIDETEDIPKRCTYELPARSCGLQRFTFRPANSPDGPPPNEVIASLSECPDHMSLEEYKALCSMPLGHRIQWQNILLQLHAPAVDFRKTETVFTGLQCIHQAGPCSSRTILRDAHTAVDDARLGRSLVNGIIEVSEGLKENWQSSEAFAMFITVATRLMSLSSTKEIRDSCQNYLTTARQITLNWVNLLRNKTQQTTEDAARAALQSRSISVALICASSFDVDGEFLEEMLDCPNAASTFLQCSIIIQEGEKALASADLLVSLLHWRWKRFCYRSYALLAARVITGQSSSLDDAIGKSWSAYRPGGTWKKLSETHNHWMVSKSLGLADENPLAVHFNLLTGELLVNGTPLDRLPAGYEQHPMYAKLFGRTTIEVMPTDVPGMSFSGKRKYAGHTIHFALHDSENSNSLDFLVRATQGDATYELVPSRILRGHFPTTLVEEHAHWYDIKNECLEFRPLIHAWRPGSHNWVLSKCQTGRWKLEKEGRSLLALRSETVHTLSDILSPLEDSLWIHMILDASGSRLNIDLPRLRLEFHLKRRAASIESHQFRDMCIDADQSIGTLVGLRNKLVLSNRKHEGRIRRVVIIPDGTVTWEKSNGHVRVTTDKKKATKVHAYEVDETLGRLVDNGSLQSKLLICYLHALTSFCLPDPLTRRTGTEEALSVLGSASVRSFQRLTGENVDLLAFIARLTPGRLYYPKNERVMQTVSWDGELGFLAQHGGIYLAVRDIFKQASRSQFFHPELYVEPPKLDNVDVDLLLRDDIRSSAFRISGFGAESHTAGCDSVYQSRDRGCDSIEGYRAFAISKMTLEGQSALLSSIPTDLAAHIYRFLSSSSVFSGHQLTTANFGYDAKWLQESSSDFITNYWTSIHEQMSSEAHRFNRFSLVMWLATLAFAERPDMTVVQTLASFLTVPEMSQITIPADGPFKPSEGFLVKSTELRGAIEPACHQFSRCPEAQMPKIEGETKKSCNNRRQHTFKTNQDRAVTRLVSAICEQWPCEAPYEPADLHSVGFLTYIDMEDAMEYVTKLFKIWHDNRRFSAYLHKLADLVPKVVRSFEVIPPRLAPSSWRLAKAGFLSIDGVFSRPAPILQPNTEPTLVELLTPTSGAVETSHLATLIARLETRAQSFYENDYVRYLYSSYSSLRGRTAGFSLQSPNQGLEVCLKEYLRSCRAYVDGILVSLMRAAAGIDATGTVPCDATVPGFYQLPRLSPVLFLQCLARRRWQALPEDWKSCIVHYGIALTKLQQAERLLASCGNESNFINELQNRGHTNWRPRDYPESLLLEIESGILIREVQEEIAGNMRSPPFGKNSLMQLNMGEGKSSVIVPIVTAALADGKRLVRVIVAKPQAQQMFQTLVSKLGGLLDRQVYHMPFSRSVKLGNEEAMIIQETLQECMSTGGVLLLQPEHMLSFKLMAVERRILEHQAVSQRIQRSLDFLNKSSRDIIDESDENFSVKFELVYTMGMQRPIDHSPNRWICVQELLDILRAYIPAVKKELPASVETYPGRAGSFPRTRILRADAEAKIVTEVANRICSSGLSGFPITQQPEEVRQAMYRFITTPELGASDEDGGEGRGPLGPGAEMRNSLLLLRGLLAGGVLAFALGQKRWRVDYGLDLNRQPQTKLAVPYRAKDNPSARSEFSHPEVVIILTSLSYYYGGLKDDDLFLAFNHLLKSDQADLEYQTWVRDADNLPFAFQQLGGINMQDHFQCVEEVFPCLCHGKAVIDYFLAHIVFPKEMKEFPHKLSASGWDIGEFKSHPTTGFSGTNDSRNVLPLTVEQLDLPDQKHTNALVLEYLLRPENSVALMKPSDISDVPLSDAQKLLDMVVDMEPPVRVILDVGAQILELDNFGVAGRWLEKLPDDRKTQAAVFVDDNDHICVLDRKGRVEPLHTSPFATQLDVCLVFLDEAHTRGTDLRLPQDYRAAVTLGANLTKDRLIQACMRMRRLGKGQSLVFCVPEEIRVKIEGLEGLSNQGKPGIRVADILAWAISETWLDARRNIPLWAVQGRRHRKHHQLWDEARSDSETMLTKSQAEEFLEEEAQSLEVRYGPRPRIDGAGMLEDISVVDGGKPDDDDPITQRCREFDSLQMLSATLQEEQERELSPEVEQERQVQRPDPAEPAKHAIHPDIRDFVSTGKLPAGSPACMPAFTALSGTSAADHINLTKLLPGGPLVTKDFARTVKSKSLDILDSYQRPVQWILTGPRHGDRTNNATIEYMIVISPYEANELLPAIKASTAVALHLYAPRPNLGFRALDKLDLYTLPVQPTSHIPRPLVVELNLFAGQLYVGSFTEYAEVCSFIGVSWQRGDVGDAARTINSAWRRFGNSSPVEFLRVLMMRIRRDCEGIEKTHMGRMLDNRIIGPEEF